MSSLCHTPLVLSVDGLGKRFGMRWVFRGITFQLSAGDALIILGRNGSGKSTLLKLLSGLTSPSEGKIKLPEGVRRTAIGLSALDMSAYAHLTVAEHLKFAATMRGCEPRIEQLLQKLGLTERRDQLAFELSTGMRSRLKLALAIQAEPALLLLDEPGAAMDAAGKAVVEEICMEQRKRGMLIVATNDPTERSLGSLELELAS